jgi:hypothetical protein
MIGGENVAIWWLYGDRWNWLDSNKEWLLCK